jgi:hypothetical protein
MRVCACAVGELWMRLSAIAIAGQAHGAAATRTRRRRMCSYRPFGQGRLVLAAAATACERAPPSSVKVEQASGRVSGRHLVITASG